MSAWNRIWPWLVAVLVTGTWAFACTVVTWLWYLYTLPPAMPALANGFTVQADSSPLVKLAPLMLLVVVGAGVGSALGVGVYFLAGRRLNPALFAVLAGPLAAFVFQMSTVLYSVLYEVPHGADYLGSTPTAISGYVLIMVVPALIASGAVVAVSRRQPVDVHSAAEPA
jgi:hypothetical protein